MLVDDDIAANFFHQIIIEDSEICKSIKVTQSATEALDYLAALGNTHHAWPDLILLDINMPRIDGWEFMEQYKTMDINCRDATRVVMLTTSSNPRDREKAAHIPEITDFINKPLTVEKLFDICHKYF